MNIEHKINPNAVKQMNTILQKALELGMDLTGKGFTKQGMYTGNVSLELERYRFTLHTNVDAGSICAQWLHNDPTACEIINIKDMTLQDINKWVVANDIRQAKEPTWFSSFDDKILAEVFK